ncbi:MAG: transglycosylase SLT domain-containing protein [Tannerellaceae bacterium]|nr:transglycosylase SLT domain-containing protein [Tannerellaceae bacterium]
MKHYLLFLAFFFVCTIVNAQEEFTEEPTYSVLSEDSVLSQIGLFPETLDVNVDSLLRSWHVRYFTKMDEDCHDENFTVKVPDSIYAQRLERLPSIIPLSYNSTVRQCIELYGERRRNLVRYMLGMADFYFPIIEQVLDEHDLPLELKYLAVVESALNPVALSRVGAAGLWQFMLPTGKSYGLEINSLIDERRDPVMSTHAACKYFKDMYAIYDDWNLVLAAYNCGPGNVNRAIKRANGKRDFWDIFPYLPKETRTYVPLYIAAYYIMNYHCEHNICSVQTTLPLGTDTVMINYPLHLEQVAEVLQMDLEQVRALNPQYKRDIIPGHIKPSVLKLPALHSFAFVENEDTIPLHRVEELLANYLILGEDSTQRARREQITHVTRQGENLYTIADKYGVTARDIRKWNGLGSNRIAQGKRIRVYVDNGGVLFAQNKPKTLPEKAPATASPVTQTTPKPASNYITYKVKSGDSLYSISKKYPGISAAVIQKTNNLPNSNIRPGQVLKIPTS